MVMYYYFKYFDFNEYIHDYDFDKIRLEIVRENIMEMILFLKNTYIWLLCESLYYISEDFYKCFIKLTLYLNFYVVSLIVPLLISVAYLTLVERKVIGLSLIHI